MPDTHSPATSRRSVARAAIESEPGPQRQEAIQVCLIGAGHSRKMLLSLIFEALTNAEVVEVEPLALDLLVHVPAPVCQELVVLALTGPEGGNPLRDENARARAFHILEIVQYHEYEQAYAEAFYSQEKFAMLRFAQRHGNGLSAFLARNRDLITELVTRTGCSIEDATAELMQRPDPSELNTYTRFVSVGLDSVRGIPRLVLTDPPSVAQQLLSYQEA